LKKIVKENDTILDVGSGTECLLGKFLPKLNITYLDPLFSSSPNAQNTIIGNIFTVELPKKKYSHIVCIDTFEHIPSTLRKQFLDKLYELAEKSIIISGPCSDVGDALKTDEWVNNVYRDCFNQDYPWLKEHFDNGLPNLSLILNTFQNFGMHTLVDQNGHTPWLKELLSFVVCALEFEDGKQSVLELSTYFNDHLFQFDHISPSYRQIVIASKEKLSDSIIDKKNTSFTKQANIHWNYLKKQITQSLTKIIIQEQIKTKNLSLKLDNAIKDVEVLQTINLKNQSSLENLQNNLVNSYSEISTLQKSLQNKESDILTLQKSLQNKESDILSLQKSLQNKESDILSLQKAIEDYQKVITDIHQSFVLRMLHKYDKTVGKVIPLRPKKFTSSLKKYQDPKEIQSIAENVKHIQINKKDLICFPITNWDFRFQRPQHILTKFAENGHRIFYLTVNPRQLKSSYELKQVTQNIFQLELDSPKFFDIYKDKFDNFTVEKLSESYEKFRKDLAIDPILFVQFPTWEPICKHLQEKYHYKIIFDCLDDFTSFSNVISARKNEEANLISSSDLVLATSSYLLKKVMTKTMKYLYLPNAGEFDHFKDQERTSSLSNYKKPIIGYFGSISDWFDTDLLEYLAINRHDFTFVMIGHTFGADIRKLQKLSNVHFLGERPYSELPKYLQDFDVCLIPFKITPLIEATHPVKIYEYFASGKPVVATKMTELFPMVDMCYLAENKEDFLQKLDLAVNEKNGVAVNKRIKFASENTWKNRFETLYNELKKNKLFDIEHHS
jgi:glycosyltransferase involved in cell wall biosynthesis